MSEQGIGQASAPCGDGEKNPNWSFILVTDKGSSEIRISH